MESAAVCDVHDFVMEVLDFFASAELCDSLWWRTDDEYAPISFFVNTNDLLAWACADCEQVTPETLPALRQAVADCEAINPTSGMLYGCSLFACRLNKMRPQGAAYPANRLLWPLFDACGPERAIDSGNPYQPGAYSR